MSSKRIAVFLGDFFWSSIPYDGLELYNALSIDFDVDLLMFAKDIRLNKKFDGTEKYKFDINVFKSVKNLKMMNNWGDLYEISSNYSFILAPTHICAKTRYPHDFRKKIKSKMIAWDIGGSDILTSAVKFADHFCVKGDIWKEWLIRMKHDESKVFVTGSPHYDHYARGNTIDDSFNLTLDEFRTKYGISDSIENIILITPSNPKTHIEHFNKNVKELEKLYTSLPESASLILKTYPSDYLYSEHEHQYSGVYKSYFFGVKQQFVWFQKKFPKIKIIESQDHFSAMKYSNAVFNMSGTHLAWETIFVDAVSYSMNHIGQAYYKHVSYLPEYVEYPDDILNVHIDNINDIVRGLGKVDKDSCSKFIMKTNAVKNIVEVVKGLCA